MLLASGSFADARWAVTGRPGGVSTGPYAELNLANHVGDEPDRVAANRGRVATELAIDPRDLRFMSQVHGVQVERVTRDTASTPEADATITQEPGIALAVLVADCVPVLLASRVPAAVAVVHAGRRGVLDGVVPATVAALRALGAEASDIEAVVGPAICGGCYEVPAAMQAEVSAAVPDTRTTTRAGTPGLDLRAGVAAQLRHAGVGSLEILPGCTAEVRDLFSYRRAGVTGRFAGLAWLPG